MKRLSWSPGKAEMELAVFTPSPRFFPLCHGCTSGTLQKCSQLSSWLDLLPPGCWLPSNTLHSRSRQTGPFHMLTSVQYFKSPNRNGAFTGWGGVPACALEWAKPKSGSSFLLPITHDTGIIFSFSVKSEVLILDSWNCGEDYSLRKNLARV